MLRLELNRMYGLGGDAVMDRHTAFVGKRRDKYNFSRITLCNNVAEAI